MSEFRMDSAPVQANARVSLVRRMMAWVRRLIARNNQQITQVIQNSERQLNRQIVQVERQLLTHIENRLLDQQYLIITQVENMLNAENRQLQNEFNQLIGQSVEVTTEYGTVIGTVVAVGEDYVELVESDGSTVLVPFQNIVGVSTV